MTRTVRDSALLMQALAGLIGAIPAFAPPDEDWMSCSSGNLRGMKVALSYGLGILDSPAGDPQAGLTRRPTSCASWAARSSRPTRLRCEAEDELEPGVWAYSGDHYSAAEAMIPNFWEKHANDLTDYNYPIYEGGRRGLAWNYRQILRRNAAYVESVKAWFQDYDLLLCPVDGPAPKVGDVTQRDRGKLGTGYTQQWNISFHPAASVPIGFDPSGLPLAIQLVGRFADDVQVMRVAAAIEATRPWGHHWPALAAAEREAGLA